MKYVLHTVIVCSLSLQSLTMYYLFKLIAEMRAIGYNHLVFPALNVAEVVARDICASDTVGSTCRLM